MRILVTGSSGYVGGRLVPRLLDAGHEVRCIARDPEKLALQPWRSDVEAVAGDVLDAASVKEAAIDCDAAYYLVNAPRTGRDSDHDDRIGATNFAEAAEAAGLNRVVYLGALGEPASPRSVLANRHEVGRILASGTTPVTELRAGVVIGSGSVSFEMIRYLTEALPLMATPTWVRSRCQPVAIVDVLDSLVAALDHDGSRIVDIGGPDILTYEEMFQIYAQEAGLRRRRMMRLPVRAARLSAIWTGLVTPLPAGRARPLIEGLRGDVVVRSRDHRVGPTSYRVAVARALERIPGGIATRWTDAGSANEASPEHAAQNGGTVYLDRQTIPTDAAVDHLYWAFSRIGGDNGYYWLDWAWRTRGVLDQMVGGVGLRRGRRHPTDVRGGEAIDFWRVEQVEPGRTLRLRAELKLPGDAWLEWEAQQTEGGSDLIQSAWFRPRGLWGRLYWWLMLPIHRAVFPRMATRIAAKGEERDYACG